MSVVTQPPALIGGAASVAGQRAARFVSFPAGDARFSGEFGESFRAWYPKVVRAVVLAGAGKHDAEDATMKAFEEMLRAGEPGRYSLAYARKAAINNFIKEKTRYLDRLSRRLDDHPHDQRDEGLQDHRLSEWETRRWREDVLSGLSPRQRQVMECHYEGLDSKEIAHRLRISPEAVRRHLSDARKPLRELLLPDGEYRRPAAPALVHGRNVSRAAGHAVAASAALAAPDRDLRDMSVADREETAARVSELRKLLLQCPAGAFGATGAVVLANVAAIALALISDRDEHTALTLIDAACPHLAFLGSQPAAFDLRRARAEALCELGYPLAAQSMLRPLGAAERRVLGAADPRTALLLLWAQAMSGQACTAETGFRDLEARLAQSPGAGPPMLWHVQCRRSWLLGERGQVTEAAGSYDGVIMNRSSELGPCHADAIDARHSKGKMLVVNGAGSQAVTILRAVADDRARTRGDRHSDTLETLKYFQLARVQAEPRDVRLLDSAIVGLEQILRIQQERHGRRYPMSRDTGAWLSSLAQCREAIRFGGPIPSLMPARLTGR